MLHHLALEFLEVFVCLVNLPGYGVFLEFAGEVDVTGARDVIWDGNLHAGSETFNRSLNDEVCYVEKTDYVLHGQRLIIA
jgi:hypothetical protein